MIGIIKRNFIHMGVKHILLYKTLVLNTQTPFDGIHTKRKTLKTLKRFREERATKLVKGLKKFSYKERLKKLHLPGAIHYRRIRGDMIHAFKIITC